MTFVVATPTTFSTCCLSTLMICRAYGCSRYGLEVVRTFKISR